MLKEGKKVILPIWHKVSYDEVKRFSPTLAGKFAAKSEKGIKQVVDDILKVINYSGHTISTSDLVNKSVNQQYDQIVHEQVEEESVSEKPAEAGQKEIVEVKPGAFGITVNIKEIAKRIWKCVCSRS